MDGKRRLYFPESISWLSIVGSVGVALLFTSIGLAAIVLTLLGRPITWSGGGEFPAWASIAIALAFFSAGMVMFARRERAVIDLQKGWVKGWRDPESTFRTSARLDDFDSALVQPVVDDGEEPVVYLLWLGGPADRILLEGFEVADEAMKRAEEVAGAVNEDREATPVTVRHEAPLRS